MHIDADAKITPTFSKDFSRPEQPGTSLVVQHSDDDVKTRHACAQVEQFHEMFKSGGTAEAADSYRDAERTWDWDAKECAPPALKNNLEKERREELARKRKLGESCEDEEDEELCAKVNAHAELRDRVKEAVLALGGGELQELDMDASDPNAGSGASESKTKSERRAQKKQEQRKAAAAEQEVATKTEKKKGEQLVDTGEEGVVIGFVGGDDNNDQDLSDFDDDELDQYIRTEEEAAHREVRLRIQVRFLLI
jgi:hypothetical protein